jgi:hypothetical protein
MSAVAELDRKTEPAETAEPASSSGSAETSGITAHGTFTGSTRRERAGSQPQPTEEQLLDVLYEVLVQGVPPRSTLTREEVETFLHQHARQTKPVSEMVAFFEQHDLPIDAGAYGADRELGELASGLQKERNSLLPGFGPVELAPEPAQLAQPLPQTLPPAQQPAVALPLPTTAEAPLEGEQTGRRPQPLAATHATGNRGLRWLAALAALIVVASLTAFALDSRRARLLEQRLDQARMQQRSTDAALTKLEQRAESLQGALKQSEAERREQTSRLQTTLEAEAQRRATEQLAVEKVLGPRYSKLRQKLTDQAASAAGTGLTPFARVEPSRVASSPPRPAPEGPASNTQAVSKPVLAKPAVTKAAP